MPPNSPYVLLSVARHSPALAYQTALRGAGLAFEIVRPEDAPDHVSALYAGALGVVLAGGGDIHPAHVGLDSETFPGNLAREIDAERDALELDLARRAHAEGKPLLGICRGQQVMNVALGGSLWVDIPSQVGGGVAHRQAGASRQAYLHTVAVCAGTRLADGLGVGQLPVNSIHHQAVERLAEGLVVNALAPDGLIEGLEDPCHPFFLGVQWHPEELYTQDPAARRLFQAFADALPR